MSRIAVIWILLLPACAVPLILLASVLVLRRKWSHGLLGCFLLGWAFQVLLALPAGIWQSLTGWGYLTTSWKWKLLIPLMGWPFNAAGLSVRLLSDPWCVRNDFSWWGFDPLAYFIPMVIQASLIAVIFAIRYKQRQTLKDRVIVGVAIMFLANSCANVYYEWLPPG